MPQFVNQSTLNHPVRASATAAEVGAGQNAVAAVSVKVEPDQILMVYGIIAESFLNVPADAGVGNVFTVIGVENKILQPQVNTLTPILADEESKLVYRYNQHPSTATQSSLRVADFFTTPWEFSFIGNYVFAAELSLVAATGNVQTTIEVLGEIVQKNRKPIPWEPR